MIFWYLNAVRAPHPEKVDAARANADQRLNTRSVFYSMADVAGITLEDPDAARLSVFSGNFTGVKRMVLGQNRVFDFDVEGVKPPEPALTGSAK